MRKKIEREWNRARISRCETGRIKRPMSTNLLVLARSLEKVVPFPSLEERESELWVSEAAGEERERRRESNWERGEGAAEHTHPIQNRKREKKERENRAIVCSDKTRTRTLYCTNFLLLSQQLPPWPISPSPTPIPNPPQFLGVSSSIAPCPWNCSLFSQESYLDWRLWGERLRRWGAPRGQASGKCQETVYSAALFCLAFHENRILGKAMIGGPLQLPNGQVPGHHELQRVATSSVWPKLPMKKARVWFWRPTPSTVLPWWCSRRPGVHPQHACIKQAWGRQQP